MKSKSEKRMRDRDTLRWIASRFKSTCVLLVAASIVQTLAAGAGVFEAFCSRDVVDAVTLGEPERFTTTVVVLVLVVLGSLALSLLNQAISERLRARSGVALQTSAFSTLLRKDFIATSSRHSGDALNRLTSDVKVVCDGASTIVPTLVSLISRLVFAFAALCYFNRTLACVFLAFGVAVFFCSLLLRDRFKTLHKDVQRAEGIKRSFWQEALGNLFVVKAFSRESGVEARSSELLADHYAATMRRRNFSLFANGGLHLLFSGSYLIAFGWQAYLVLIGSSTFGAFTAVLQLVAKVQSPFAGLSSIVPKYFNALASAERIRELEELPDESGAGIERVDGRRLYDETRAIVFDDVTFRYEREGKSVEVLKNASFRIPIGENIVVCGRSGIGKSTLFKLLTGVCAPNSGRIYLESKSGEETPVDSRTRNLFALVPQGNMLFSGSIEENLRFFGEPTDENAEREALRLARGEFVDELAEGRNAKLGEKGAGLSEGQIQRVAIARAALDRAPILLLDEATSALDAEAEREALRRISEESGKTFVFVSHRPAAFEFADARLEIDEGRAVLIRK